MPLSFMQELRKPRLKYLFSLLSQTSIPTRGGASGNDVNESRLARSQLAQLLQKHYVLAQLLQKHCVNGCLVMIDQAAASARRCRRFNTIDAVAPQMRCDGSP